MPIIPLTCPCCGANLTIDSEKDAAICEFCGKPFIVKDAIVQNYITNVTNITADTVNVYSQKDFDVKGGVLEHYNGESVDVVIPDNVVKIGERAFSGLAIRSVTIPDSVTEIGGRAFSGCTNLLSVTIGSGIKTIADEAFDDCSIDRVNYTGDLARWCSISFDGITANPMAAALEFYLDGELLTDVVIPAGVTYIGDCAFAVGSGIKSVAFPDSVTKIGRQAFCGCTGLTSITIPNSVNDIAPDAFASCDKLSSVTCSERLERAFIRTPWWNEKNWRLRGLCRHCGGLFSGVFNKTCSKCGKPKDY
ncbi:MAG: leucine-rich repeat domain-containing protein [Oscillospiraceae bacterium]|nr:leucine-rich repeat domain-containing protein [Oscillospiraceae bacterium]